MVDEKDERVSEIISEVEAEEPERRIFALEAELNELKGSIKKLLVDLREQMNNIENPFQDMRQLTTLIQPGVAPEVPSGEEEEEKKEEEAKRKEEEETKREEEEAKRKEAYEGLEEPIPLEGLKEELEGEKIEVKEKLTELIDPFSLGGLMEWTESMLKKYGRERFEEILDISHLTGYASDKIVNVIFKISRIYPDFSSSAEEINSNDLVIELHRLKSIFTKDTKKDKFLELLLK
ncbi:MAG: hypothetical protein MASP_00208 [Candidatus Methanolliviera sp. GoM_asphalt]|nr:MAG: hypothetical protein MASP_00208 [Candidatus Methanolliviera sp. GoM_asphalt]